MITNKKTYCFIASISTVCIIIALDFMWHNHLWKSRHFAFNLSHMQAFLRLMLSRAASIFNFSVMIYLLFLTNACISLNLMELLILSCYIAAPKCFNKYITLPPSKYTTAFFIYKNYILQNSRAITPLP